MELCLTSRILSSSTRSNSTESRSTIHHIRQQIRSIYGQPGPGIPKRRLASDVVAVLTPSAALMTLLSPTALMNLASSSAAGIARQSVIRGASGNGKRSHIPWSEMMRDLGRDSSQRFGPMIIPIGVYFAWYSAIKYGFRFDDRNGVRAPPIEYAMATGTACLMARWSMAIAAASAVQVGLYELMANDEEGRQRMAFNAKAGLIAGLASGGTFLAVEHVVSPVLRQAVNTSTVFSNVGDRFHLNRKGVLPLLMLITYNTFNHK